MTAVEVETNNYSAAFRQLTEQRASEPAWLTRAREGAFEQFERVGFPTVREEDWKYTNVAPIAKAQFTPANLSSVFSDWVVKVEPGRLIFVNGIFQPALSLLDSLPDGLQVIDLAEASAPGQYESAVRAHFDRFGKERTNGFAALNTALFSRGVLLSLSKSASIKKPIELQFTSLSTNGNPLAAFPRVLIVAAENSEATIIESYSGNGPGTYFTNAIVDFVLGDGARVQHFKVQRESTNAFHVAETRSELGPNAKYDSTAINLGAAISRHGIDVTMDNEGAECAVDGLYMIDDNQHADTHSVIDHRQPHCTSHQLYKGILDGKSRAVFNGKVFVRHGAQQTVAQQTNKNLLLSNEAQVDTKPQLEIFADDVKCAHGAAIGQLEEDELFYLESRGINPALARNMLTYGFAEEVIEKIKIDSIKRELDEAVLNRLHSGLSIEG